MKVYTNVLSGVFREYEKEYDELLRDHNLSSIHQKHLKFLALEIYKCLNNLNPEFLWEIFTINETGRSTRSGQQLCIPKAKSILNGVNSIEFRGAIFWNSLTPELKELPSLSQFKTKLKLRDLPCNCLACR